MMRERWRYTIPLLLRSLFGRERVDRELDDELQDHIECQTQADIERGLAPGEARRAALRKLGNVMRVKEDTRDVSAVVWLERLLQDVRYAFRALAKGPVIAATAVLTLALGIGSTSAVFSVVDRVLFRSLPYSHSEQLVSFGFATPFSPNEFIGALDFMAWRRDSKAFTEVTATHPGGRECELSEQNPVRLECQEADANFLPTLGVQPLLGRNFTREEDEPGAAPVALLSYGLWRSRYGGDRGIVGRSISVDGKATGVVGVLPASFEMPELSRADLLMPMQLDFAGLGPDRPQPLVLAFARLRPGVSVAAARASLEPVFEQTLKTIPAPFRGQVTLRVRSLRDRQFHDARTASWVLLAAVIALLLLATANVANLRLARAAVRRRETAVRAALGATPVRLMRQSLTESVVLSLLGGSAGCAVAYGLLRLFVAMAPAGIETLQRASLDARVLLFTLGISIASAFLFGSAPAWQAPQPAMLSGKAARPMGHRLLRQLLVTSQIAMSLVLLTGAFLLLRTLWKLQAVPLGMSVRNVLTAEIGLARYRYPDPAQQQAFFERLEEGLRRIPGVAAFGLSDTLPPAGRGNAVFYSNFEIAGRPRLPEQAGGMIGYRAVTEGYFAALGIRILEGRAFENRDLAAGANAVILNRSLAENLFGNENPVGQRIRFGPTDPWHVVIGVAADVKNNGLEAHADPELYITWGDPQQPAFDEAHVVIRTPVDPKTMASWLRSEVAALDPRQPVMIETMAQRVSALEDAPRFDAILLTVFAFAGLMLAGIGIYGVVGFLAAERTGEIGLRMALGATPRAILRMMLGDVARWTAWGALAGLAGSWFASRLLRSLLFEVPPHDGAVAGAVVGLIVFITFLAAWLPARRAARVDPVIALRHE